MGIPFPKRAGNQIYIDCQVQGIETVSAGFAHNMATQHVFTLVFPQVCAQTTLDNLRGKNGK